MPPGTAPNGFNVTVVSYTSDNLGATAATSRGSNGSPLAFLSTLPDEVHAQEHAEESTFVGRTPTVLCVSKAMEGQDSIQFGQDEEFRQVF